MDEQKQNDTVKTPQPGLIADFVEDPSLVGQTLSDRYSILSEVGRGGMGTVYKAEHTLLNKIQAVKVLHRHLAVETQNFQRFQVEAKAASDLRHENLLTVTDFGMTESKQPYIVMDYIEGESLAEYLKKHKRLTVQEFKDVFVRVLLGLAHAHQKGVIHRDLKPSNIMISMSDGKIDLVRIVDFGIAKVLPNDEGAAQHLTQTGEIFGSPYYMSPEQCLGGKIDQRSDIYSLGCVMFEALTGVVPIKEPSAVQTLSRHISGPVPSISAQFPQLRIPNKLELLVAKASATDPTKRYQSADDLRFDLEKLNPNELAPPPVSVQTASGNLLPPPSSSPKASTPGLAKRLGMLMVLIVLVQFIYGTIHHENKNNNAHKVDTLEDSNKLMREARRLEDKGKNSEALDKAREAYEIRDKVAPQTPFLAESSDLLGYLTVKNIESDDYDKQAKQDEAEGLYKTAIRFAPVESAPSMNSAKPTYMYHLAELYLDNEHLKLARDQIDAISKVVNRPFVKLDSKDADDRKLLQLYAKLNWKQGRYVEAAKLEVQLRSPLSAMANLSVPPNPKFEGNWLYNGRRGKRLFVSISKVKSNDLAAELFCDQDKNLSNNLDDLNVHFSDSKSGSLTISADKHNLEIDRHASGSFKGPVGELAWTGLKGHGSAVIVRVGDYLVWKMTQPPSRTMCPETALLSVATPSDLETQKSVESRSDTAKSEPTEVNDSDQESNSEEARSDESPSDDSKTSKGLSDLKALQGLKALEKLKELGNLKELEKLKKLDHLKVEIH